MQQITFNRVFQASGTGRNGKPYTRWDYKTADDQRYAHFAGSQEIPLNTPVLVELSPSGSISSWQHTGSPTTAADVQTTTGSQNGSEAVSEAPVASQRDTQIHRQTAAKVAAKLLDFFPADEQSLETFFTVAEQLVAYFQNGVTETVPF